jgi:hypothetical protein
MLLQTVSFLWLLIIFISLIEVNPYYFLFLFNALITFEISIWWKLSQLNLWVLLIRFHLTCFSIQLLMILPQFVLLIIRLCNLICWLYSTNRTNALVKDIIVIIHFNLTLSECLCIVLSVIKLLHRLLLVLYFIESIYL